MQALLLLNQYLSTVNLTSSSSLQTYRNMLAGSTPQVVSPNAFYTTTGKDQRTYDPLSQPDYGIYQSPRHRYGDISFLQCTAARVDNISGTGWVTSFLPSARVVNLRGRNIR